MQNIVSFAPLYKRDSKGKVRVWTIQVGFNNENEAGTRAISGLVNGVPRFPVTIDYGPGVRQD